MSPTAHLARREAASCGAQATTIETSAAQPRLRVLHIYRRFHPDYTGDGIYYTRLIPHLAALGIDNEVLAYETRTGAGEATAVHEGVPVHYLANRPAVPSTAALLSWLRSNLRRYDLVHIHSHVDRTFLAYAFARAMGRPVLFSCTLEDSPTQLVQGYAAKGRWLVSRLLHTISGFVVISPHLLRRSMETMPLERLHFVPQGVALDRTRTTAAERRAARERLGVSPDDLLLLNVGSVSRRKNVALLIEALSRTPDPKVKLVVVGPLLEDDYVAEIRAQLAATGLADRVILAGFEADPSIWYKASDAFLFASTAEGFPNVYLEAMAWGLPIVSLFLPGLTDFIIDHGRSGFLVRDIDGLADAIGRLREDPALRERMGAEARRFADRNLEIGKVAGRYADLYLRYRGGGHAPATSNAFPDFDVRFTRAISDGPEAAGIEGFDTPASWPPLLQVVIDLGASAGATAADLDVPALQQMVQIVRAQGAAPCLAVDHAVASDDRYRPLVREFADQGCEIAALMDPWVTPPLVEPSDDWHTFSGNLGAPLERAKIAHHRGVLEKLLGDAPRAFKAGRHGLGHGTLETLEALGFEIDLSIRPGHDLSRFGGPDFTKFSARPGRFGRARRLLSLPATAARRRLSPQDASLQAMKQMTRSLRASGLGVFTLSLSAAASDVDPRTRRRLAGDLERYLNFFRTELGGAFTSPSALQLRLAGAAIAQP